MTNKFDRVAGGVSERVAEEARKTFDEIKELRKTMPSKFAFQKKELEDAIRKKQDEWWERVKQYFDKGGEKYANL